MPVAGSRVLPVCPAFPLWSGRWGGVVSQVGARVAWNSCCQACCQGQCSGRCMVSWRAERASRPGTAVSWVRIEPVVARAWKREARVPAARVRLNAIVARTSQALFAGNDPDAKMSQRPGPQVGVDLLDDGLAAVVGLGLDERERAVGEYAVVEVEAEQLALLGRTRAGLAGPAGAGRAAAGVEAFDGVNAPKKLTRAISEITGTGRGCAPTVPRSTPHH